MKHLKEIFLIIKHREEVKIKDSRLFVTTQPVKLLTNNLQRNKNALMYLLQCRVKQIDKFDYRVVNFFRSIY